MIIVLSLVLIVILRMYQLIQTGLSYTLMGKIAKERTLKGGLRALRIVSVVHLVPIHTLFTLILYLLVDGVVFPIADITSNSYIWVGFFAALFLVMPYIYLELKQRVVVDETRSWGLEERPDYIEKQKRIDDAIDEVIATDEKFN